MKREWMNTRQTRYSAYTTAYVLVVAAVLVGVNYLSSQHTKSIDLTANKRYTLSDQTTKIVKNLKDEVKIYYFDDTKNFQSAKDLLDQYEALSGKLKVQYVDTVKNPRLLREFNVTVAPTTIIVHDKRQSEAHGVTEQELTSALIRVLKNGEKTACFLTGNGERELDGNGGPDFAGVKDALKRNNFNTDAITLIATPEIPATCSVVVAAGPKSDYQPAEVEALKSYVEKGGHALFLLDPPLDSGRSRIAPNEALVKVLGEWGVTLEKNLVLEVSGLSRLGPEWALGNHFGSHPIVRDMKGSAAAFPLTRSLDAKPGANTTAEVIVSTSKSSFATTQITGKGIAIDPSKGEKELRRGGGG